MRNSESKAFPIWMPVTAVLLGLCVGCALGEIAVRLVHPQPTAAALRHLVERFYDRSDYIPFTLQADYKGDSLSMEHPGSLVTVTTNALRTRGALPRPKVWGRQRIVIVGDSYTFGVYVPDSNTYASRLEQLLRKTGCDVDVIIENYVTL